MHLLSPCSWIAYHGNNVRWCTGLRSCTDVVLKGFISRLTYTRMCHVSDN